jgi:hypothetical protein
MATDAWEQVRGKVVALWQRLHPDEAREVELELAKARPQVLAARSAEDTDTEQALTAVWRLRLQQLVSDHPGAETELRRLMDQDLVPLLTRTERSAVATIMTANAKDQSRIYQAGRDQHISG